MEKRWLGGLRPYHTCRLLSHRPSALKRARIQRRIAAELGGSEKTAPDGTTIVRKPSNPMRSGRRFGLAKHLTKRYISGLIKEYVTGARGAGDDGPAPSPRS
jgi:hypothetical protein